MSNASLQTTASELSSPDTPVISAGYMSTPPPIDGVIQAGKLKGAAVTNIFRKLSGEDMSAESHVARIGFDDSCLYLAITVPLSGGTFTVRLDSFDYVLVKVTAR